MNGWQKVPDEMPENGQRVIAHFTGVYDYRLVTFWRDGGGRGHFGHPSESDGKGSQPATHWIPLADLPNASAHRECLKL